MIKSVLVDARNVEQVLPAILDELRSAKVYGFDIETQDEERHEGLNLYNTKVRHVFDHRRTVITGFSTYVENSDTAYYFNTAHADVENRLPWEIGLTILEAGKEAICVAHNAPYELCMVHQCWDGTGIPNIVCTLQMAVSHHGPDEYDLGTFFGTPLNGHFRKLVPQILNEFQMFDAKSHARTSIQSELIGKFIAKESKAEHSYNGFVKGIARGYSLKKLTWSTFGYKQTEYQALLDAHGATHMGELTGEQVVSYGADDAYWAVKHYRHMFDDMIKNNPLALRAFFETENPMVQIYADSWRNGIRLDLPQVFERQKIERADMAKVLRHFKGVVRDLLPFSDDPHPKMLEKQDWYAKDWKKKRQQIVDWAAMPDVDDDFEQTFQVSNPIGNGWAMEKGIEVPKSGKLNLVYYHGMRTLIYDLAGCPLQYSEGSLASDSEARGKIREKLEKLGLDGPMALMADLQKMSEIEQKMKLYLTPYTQLMDPETGRVYPSLSSQLASRRLATSFPNPMQLAKSGESAYIRSFYLADDDESVVLSADWSAIELVLIGDQSGDPGFAKVYGQIPYGDMHSGAAVDALSVKTLPGLTEEEFREFKFGRNPDGRVLRNFAGVDLSPSDYHKFARGTAVGKGVNFSYWYSGALSTVAQNLGLSDEEHWELVENYRNRFAVAEAWRVGVQNTASQQGFLVLPDGHRRNRFEVTNEWRTAMKQKFVDITADPALLAYADVAIRRIQGRSRNQVVNSAIQGTNATLTKRSLLRLITLMADAGYEYGVDARLMMPIHDEMVFSVKRGIVVPFIKILRRAMTEHPTLVKTLPLHATVAIGRTFRPFNKVDPRLSQIELDEAQFIDGVIPKELEGTVLSDEKIEELVTWMFKS